MPDARSIDDTIGAESLLPKEPGMMEPLEAPEGRVGFDMSFLKAKTGEGSIESYIDHPMNFNKSKSLGQIIRGMTGMLGALDLAIIDIVMGGFNFMKERKTNVPTHTL